MIIKKQLLKAAFLLYLNETFYFSFLAGVFLASTALGFATFAVALTVGLTFGAEADFVFSNLLSSLSSSLCSSTNSSP